MKLEKLSENKKVFFILSLIVILGFGLRVYHIGKPSLWFDELNTVGRSHYQPPQILGDLYENPFPPLYYIIMHYWIKISGDSEFSLRFPSLICSVLTIIFVFILSRELFDEKVGLFSALFVSLSAYSIYYAQEAKMYSMLWLFGILSFLFFHRFRKDNRTVNLLFYILFTLVAIYTLYIGFIFMIIQNIAFFSLLHGKRTKKWLLGQLAIILLYLPWLGRFLYHVNHKTGTSWLPKVSSYPQLFQCIFSRTLCSVIRQNNIIELSVYSLLILAAFVNITKGGKKRCVLDFKTNDFLLILWIIVPFFIYWLINTFVCSMLCVHTERYIGFIYIPLFIFISKGINKYGPKIKSIILIFLLIRGLFFGVFPLYRYNYRVIHRENWRKFSQQLIRKAESGSLLIVSDIPLYIVPYYIKGYEIKPLSYIDVINKEPFDKRPPSIFVIYTFSRDAVDIPSLKNKLKGYQLKENYYKYPNGFLWFKKSK